jgi:hypothetical protein
MSQGTLVLFLTLGLSVGQAEKVYTLRDRNIQIPIVIPPERRGELRELILFVSNNQGKSWDMAALAKPEHSAFVFHAPSDGQYWFKVQAVYQGGNREPADIYAAPVNMKVAIDSQQQLLKIIAFERTGDEVRVAWEVTGTQADVMSLKLEFRAADMGPNAPWQSVPLQPSASGQQRFKPASGGPIAVKMQINDQAGSPVAVVKELPGATANATVFAPVANSNPITAAVPPAIVQQTNSLSAASTAPGGAALPTPVAPQDVPAPAPPVAQAPTGAPPAPPAHPPAVDPSTASPSGLTPLPAVRTGPGPNVSPQGGPRAANASPPLGVAGGSPTRADLPPIQHVRDAQVSIDFAVEQQGPSGVKKIEVYMTQDDGETWRPWTETYDVNSPLQVQLPQAPYEGTFGFKLVAYSGVLQSFGPPQRGDAPDVRLHVDRTPPKVDLYPLEPDPAQVNAVLVRYKAIDSNLLPNGISLYWAPQQTGPWSPIQVGVGRPLPGYQDLQECSWALPPNLPNRVYLRVTARDLAGNVGEFITRDPVTVDLHKPVVRFKGINAGKPAGIAPPNQPFTAFGAPQ